MTQHIFDDCYIVISEYGIHRMTKRKGALRRGEIAVKVSLTVPVSAFAEPCAHASIVVPESAIIRPTVEVAVEDASS